MDVCGDQLRFEVGDVGCGIDPAAPHPGSGLLNIRDRVEACGGSVEVTSGAAGPWCREWVPTS